MATLFRVVLLGLFAISAWAAPVDEATARRVAHNYITQHIALHGDWAGHSRPTVNRVALVSHEGVAIGYLASVNPSGYLLVSYDDDLVPVIIYAPIGNFEPDNVMKLGSIESWILPETKIRLQSNAERLAELQQVADESLAARLRDESPAARAWAFFDREVDVFQPLLPGINEKVGALDGVNLKADKLGPLLRTAWNQGEDRAPYTYNLYTPAASGCAHTVTGCVATAAAQILKYWNWPDRGTGTSSYTWQGQTLSANYDFAYNWSAMPASLGSASSSAQIDSVARLMQHVGVAFRMSYGCGSTGGSGAVTDDVATVFPQYFKFRTGIRTVTRSAVSAAVFFQTIQAELDANPPRPILFSMRTSSGGHAVVVDGYQTGVTNMVQVNMGWGGFANAFYDISNDWAAGGNNWIASTQRAFVNIQPTSSTSCSYALGSSGASVSVAGGSGSVQVTAGSTCAWSVTSNASWITVSPGSGTGTANIGYSVAPNTGSGARSGSLTIGGQIFSVTQAGGSCTYALSSASQTFSSGSGSATLSITTGAACTWSVAPSGSWSGAGAWLTFLSPTSGIGTSTISYSVSPNTAATARTASLSIAGQSHAITQSGTCSYAVYPSSQSAPAAAGSANFRLEAGSTCAWVAETSASWISISPPTSGTGSASITYSTAANTSASVRTGTIIAGRQTVTVTQAAAGAAATGIANGDFEQGRTVWTEQGSQLLYNDPARARTGYWMAWLGGYDNGTDTLSQTFTVPANAASVNVRFWTYITTSEGATTTPYDVMTVAVHNSVTGARITTLGSFSNANATTGWIQTPAYNLTAFRGQSIRLVFSATMDVSNPTNFYVDDVTLAVVGSTCTYQVAPLSQNIGSTISTISFTVTTNPTTGCNWSAASTAAWLSVSGAGSGTGSAEVRLSAAENTTPSARIGSATIAGQVVSVTQAAATLDSSIVKNGEFESGSESWQEASTGGYGIIGADPGVAARTGVGYAWLAGYNAGTDTLTQPINIPGNITSAQLSFWYSIRTAETLASAYDTLTVEVVDAVTAQVLVTVARLSNLDKTSAWIKSADVDVSAFKGRAVRLVFRASMDVSEITSFFVDSVKISLVGSEPGVASRLLQRGGVDMDGDGRGEIVVRSVTGAMLAGRLVGTRINWQSIADPGASYRVMAAVDLDSQGRSDLVMLNMAQGDSGEARIWTAFNPSLPKTLRNVRTLWQVEAVGDLDGDGKGDLVWRFTGNSGNIDDTGVSYIWFTNGSGVTQVRKRGGAPLNWTLLGATDLNGDGAADMIYVSPTKQIRALMATANRTCANLSGGTIDAGLSVLALGSFSGVGKGEIMLRDNAGWVQFMALNARGISLPAFTGTPDDPNASCSASPNLIPSTFVRVGNASDPNWQFFTTADLNGDGINDIVWRRGFDGGLVVWIMADGGQVAAVYNDAGAVTDEYRVIQR